MILDFAVITICNGQNIVTQLGGVSTTDLRLTDARTPLPHTHPVSDVGGLSAALAAKEDRANRNQPSGYAGLNNLSLLSGSAIPYGAATATACVGNDPRLDRDRILTDGANVLVGSGNVLWGP